MHEYDIEVAPGVIYDDLISFNTEKFLNKLQIIKFDNKHILLKKEDIEVKIKFYEILKRDQDYPGRTRIRFERKQGDLYSWSLIFKRIFNEQLSDVL